jgi:hypothetical protein
MTRTHDAHPSSHAVPHHNGHEVAPSPVVTVPVEPESKPLTPDEAFWIEEYRAAFAVLGKAELAKAEAHESVRILAAHGIGPTSAGLRRVRG